jgi:alpha-L-fucosidase
VCSQARSSSLPPCGADAALVLPMTIHHVCVVLLMLLLSTVDGITAAAAAAAAARPTVAQLAWQSFDIMPLRTFHHFDICTFTGCEHNSGTANRTRGSGAPSDFAPSAVNATQWVLAAKSLGAGSAVMTARHEGGFALWPSKFTNYSIAHSPYKNGQGDIVMEFVTACRAHGIKPGLYIAAGCDAYHHCGPEGSDTASEYLRRQTGMVRELVSGTYGHIEYLWFDHHGNPVNSTSPFGPWCPHMCDPMSQDLWTSIDETVKKYGGTTLGGGADLNIGPTEPPTGDTPLWMACNTTDNTIHTRPTGFGPYGQFYRPSEITNMLTTGGWFHHHGQTKPKSVSSVLELIWGSIGRGYSFIGNVPPNQAGVLDDDIVAMMNSVGRSIRGFWASSVGNTSGECTDGEDTVTLHGLHGQAIQTIALRELLMSGQQVVEYVVEGQTVGSVHWAALSQPRATIGNLFLHNVASQQPSDLRTVNAGRKLDKIRVRCLKSVSSGAKVSLNALTKAPLDVPHA